MLQNYNKQPVLCFVAGKSGGHIIPCLTRAKELLKRYDTFQILFFSTTGALDTKIIANNPSVTHHISLPLNNLPYRRILGYPVFLWQFCKSVCMAWYYLKKMRPQRVVSTGGYIAIPVCLAAYILKIPIELQALDVVPGKAIQLLSPLAQFISICFEQTKSYLPEKKCYLVSYPIRFDRSVLQLSRDAARKTLGLDPNRFTIFILGGSQGSVFLNHLFKEWINRHARWHGKLQVIHQTGSNDTTDWQEFYQKNSICAFVFSYYDQLQFCYRASNIILSRAGAGTLFEIQLFQVPTIMIPLVSKTTAHQVDNAQAMAKKFPQTFFMISQQDVARTRAALEPILEKFIIA